MKLPLLPLAAHRAHRGQRAWWEVAYILLFIYFFGLYSFKGEYSLCLKPEAFSPILLLPQTYWPPDSPIPGDSLPYSSPTAVQSGKLEFSGSLSPALPSLFGSLEMLWDPG